ncbi:MAG: GIY-YIG nuclease family protein [Clostridia bacterium]|nr:GIY-YIG nuclease family protein [Clostridia bacterium]
MNKNFFPRQHKPQIYAYRDNHPNFKGYLKVGFTSRDIEVRMKEHYPTLLPGEKPYEVVFLESSYREDGSYFKDYDVHKILKEQGFDNINGEWFKCSVKDVQSAVFSLKNKIENKERRLYNFSLRQEQENAILKTINYFNEIKKENKNIIPHFLWNAKMRFGKTFTTYKLAERMNLKRILILTFKPAVESSWEEDLNTHIDFEGWQFVSRHTTLKPQNLDYNKPIVCFGSFQDYLGLKDGMIKHQNEWVHTTNWDLVVFDEYHFGAWRDSAKDLFEKDDLDKDISNKLFSDNQTESDVEQIMPITTSYYLYLSGTPFRAIANGEFMEEQIFNWTYSDEQKAKQSWKGDNNPYAQLPRMVLLTYQLPDSIREIALQGEYNEFDLNTFFMAKGEYDSAEFIYKSEVQKWLDLIRGSFSETTVDNLKQGADKAILPFTTNKANLQEILQHTLWFLPNVASCYAMNNLLKEKQNWFYQGYKIVVCAGARAGIGLSALEPVKKAMTSEPLKTRTITLSCGKLTTGVTVKPWTGIFMLRNLSSPETYFQAAFRVQSPWTLKNLDGLNPNEEEIIKRECYIFDFAPDRALRQIQEYSCRLDISDSNPEKKVQDFIEFLPVLSYDGMTMKKISPAELLDIVSSGTTATLLARRWESAMLVNVENATLERLLNNSEALEALMSIEGFRNINVQNNIEFIINKSNAVKQIKKQATTEDRDLTKKEKDDIKEKEKEYKSKRKQIQEKLIKFATRIPIFMYLTDYREQVLQDVITQLEPGLFKRVTGLEVKDFELLTSLGLFNAGLMNQAVFQFRRYEDSSLSYTGINKHKGEVIGGWDTTIHYEDIKKI